MKKIFAFLILAGCTTLPGETVRSPFTVYRDQSVPIASAATFDPARYLGTWYEIARFPVVFEAGCVGVTAEYGAISDSEVSVKNTCRNPDGSERSVIEGSATVVGPGRLKVSFPSVPFGAADYWVLWIDEDYRTAVVGAPNGRSGWILNRAPTIAPDRLQAAKDILDFNGYDVSQLFEVPQ